MYDDILKISHSIARDGAAFVPGDNRIFNMINWDEYKSWYDSGYTTHVWEIVVALISPDDTTIKIRQTINSRGQGVIRKHEMAFAFFVQDLVSVELQAYPFPEDYPDGGGVHGSQGTLVIPGLTNSSGDVATVKTFGPPSGIALTFNKPVAVRRYSEMPITAGRFEHELSVFQISFWLASPLTAQRAKETFSRLAEQSKSSAGNIPLPAQAPQFGDIPTVPPGSISRF